MARKTKIIIPLGLKINILRWLEENKNRLHTERPKYSDVAEELSTLYKTTIRGSALLYLMTSVPEMGLKWKLLHSHKKPYLYDDLEKKIRDLEARVQNLEKGLGVKL